MQSFRTLYRLIVMGVTVVILIQVWKLYGPPADQVKSLALRAVEWAGSLLQDSSEQAATPNQEADLSTDSPKDAPSLVPLEDAATPDGEPPNWPAPPLIGQRDTPVAPEGSGLSSDPASDLSTGGAMERPVEEQATTSAPVPLAPDADRLDALYGQLEQLGAHDYQLLRWGEGRELYRFCCQATWGQSPQFTRHFESVAAEPLTAVQQVLSEIDAWRVAQRDTSDIR